MSIETDRERKNNNLVINREKQTDFIRYLVLLNQPTKDVKFVSFMLKDEIQLPFFLSFGNTYSLALQFGWINGKLIQDYKERMVTEGCLI